MVANQFFMSKFHKNNRRGFTLIELVVVIALIGMLTLFIVPKFDSMLFSDNTKLSERWIIYTVMNLKIKAVKERKDYILHADVSGGYFWISDETTEDDALEEIKENTKFSLPEGVKLAGVIFPDNVSDSESSNEIRFYKQGYSSMAMIYLETIDEEKISLLIEPFLNNVNIIDGFAEF